MIEYLRGSVASVGADHVVVDVGGVGMRVDAPPSATARWHTGEQVTVATSMVVREDSWTLFGFADDGERDIFRTVQAVSGIGPKTALALVGVLGGGGLRDAVAQQDEKALMNVPGIGRKGAQRLLLELGDRLPAPPGADLRDVDGRPPGAVRSSWRVDVVSALESLGWSQREAGAAVDALVSEHGEDSVKRWGAAGIIKAALRELSRV